MIKQLLSFLPRRLPTGMTEFEQMVDRIADLVSDFTTRRDDIVFSLSTAIMHVGPLIHMKSDRYFVLMIRAGAAKQIAGANFRLAKERQIEAAKIEEAAKLAEATAQVQVVANEETKP